MAPPTSALVTASICTLSENVYFIEYCKIKVGKVDLIYAIFFRYYRDALRDRNNAV